MTSPNSVYAGVDVGASRTKVAILNAERELVGHCVEKSGTDFAATANRCLETSLTMARVSIQEISNVVSTGYGRKNVSFEIWFLVIVWNLVLDICNFDSDSGFTFH